MTKTEQNRVLAWRLKVLREASAAPRNVVSPIEAGTLLSPPHSDSPWAKPTAGQSEASPSWASVAAL
jgi:hypothetical protein